MKTIFRDPQVEEAPRNVILQNRCGNRLTLLCHEYRCELEFVYKPNAFRRKDYRARNFSNRDVFTTLFAGAQLPEIKVACIREFQYDPFVTRLAITAPSGARNTITVVNVGDENCFAIAARCPLTLTFRPHQAFEASDGLLAERFCDRGEEIVSFVSFPSYELNRYRVLDDGTHVLQIMEDDVVLVGGEETRSQVDRVLKTLRPLDLPALISRTERAIAPALADGVIRSPDARLQQLLDLNRRLVYSGLDEGGACFGALNRIYHLIWLRDGSMTAAMFSRAGTQEMARIWTPFALANPSERLTNDGERAREYLQIAGTRWTKAEDDGIYYVVLSLFHLYTRTGDDRLLRGELFSQLIEAIDHLIAKRYRPQECLFASDTIGETTLPSSPYYGYDTVNGLMYQDHHFGREGRNVTANLSLYYNVNLYNVLKMAQALIRAAGAAGQDRLERYAALAASFEKAIAERFVSPEGIYYTGIFEYDDGTRETTSLTPDSNPWEYSWAVTVGPFLPDPALSLASARAVAERWKKRIGYCPWNCIAGALKEYGLPSTAYRAMMEKQVHDAFNDNAKYPMAGALTEYSDWKDTWHGLPFSIATFVQALAGHLLQALPFGVAVRAGTLVDRIESYAYRDARLWATAEGDGDTVGAWELNGAPVKHSLVIPQSMLRMGVNRVNVRRAAACDEPRLFSATACLLDAAVSPGAVRYAFTAPVDGTFLVFDNFERFRDVRMTGSDGAAGQAKAAPLLDTGKTLVRVPLAGDFVVEGRV